MIAVRGLVSICRVRQEVFKVAVVKNMIVRVGADLSGLVSGFKKGSGATGNFAKRAAKDVSSLKEKLSHMESSYQSITKATANVNLSQPISKQIASAQKEYDSLQKTATDLEKQINWWGSVEPVGLQFKTDDLRSELNAVDLKVENLVQTIKQLEDIDNLGRKLGMSEVSSKSLNKLQADIVSVRSNLRAAEKEAKETGQSLNMLGALKGIASSASKLEKLAGSIKRIGVLSLGLRLTKALFGELQSVVNQYVSENSALQAQVNALKSSLGQALAPAINLVTNALSVLMPYVVGVSNAIGSLISNLFGSGWTTVADGANSAAAAIGGAGGAQKEFNRQLAGFDEITKLTADSGGGGGGGASVSTSTAESKTPAWLTSLSEQIRQAAGSGDFFGVGAALANAINTGIDSINLADSSLGGKISDFVNSFVDGATGLVQTTNWAGLGEAISKNVSDLIGGIDWAGVFELAGSAVAGFGSMIWGAIGDSLTSALSNFEADLEAAGGNVWYGIGLGIGRAIANVGTWIKENIFNPFVEGFKNIFDIHSPSQNEEINAMGENIMLGIFEGIAAPLKDPIAWIKENVFTPLVEGFKKVFGEEGLLASLLGKSKGKSSGTASVEINATAKLTAWKDKLKNKVTNFKANLTTWRDKLKDKATSFKANMTTWRDKLKDKATNFKANLTTWRDKLKNKATNFKANLTTWRDKLKDKATSFKANMTTWRDKLKGKATNFKANLTTWKDSLKDKSTSFKANLTSWKDSISDKYLSLKAHVTQGWTGSLASALGITSITSKLDMKLPKISIDWGYTTIFSKLFSYPKGFKVQWNETGVIMDGAQLFGRVGNTLLGGGEAGREALLPLDRHTGWMDKIADRVALRVVTSQTGGQDLTINLILDGKVVTKTVVKNINAQARATGQNPLAAYL